ncbi:hypothetical protein BDV29DRAFT_178354 [Aspergillus leporis]|uniref:Secreted protein n=1 Tax=Aspergillus leporis TaxID=41062 RepID=A0A5N5WXD7_9EURO|nr:hypothetical protein BDV29DRAFT_178354 [Aspergillus leporis]
MVTGIPFRWLHWGLFFGGCAREGLTRTFGDGGRCIGTRVMYVGTYVSIDLSVQQRISLGMDWMITAYTSWRWRT